MVEYGNHEMGYGGRLRGGGAATLDTLTVKGLWWASGLSEGRWSASSYSLDVASIPAVQECVQG